MENKSQAGWNTSEDFSLLKQAGREAIRAILSEDARIQALPIIQKAGAINDLINYCSDTLGDSDIENQYKKILRIASFEMSNKLVIAENSPYYNEKIENSILVKIAAKKVLNQLAGMEVIGIINLEYSKLIRDEIEGFRLLFLEWVISFERKTILSDGWDIV
jgi:hypothetical protein